VIATQIPMDLAFRTALGRENFLVAPPNEEAVNWIDLWPRWPANFLLVTGPEGCGKTHLCRVWAERARAVTISLKELEEKDVSDLADLASTPMVLEDLGTGLPEEKLFHLYNLVMAADGSLLMTSKSSVSEWNVQLPDLKSRLGAIQVTRIGEPDDMLFASILLKLFSDRQLTVSPDAVQYLMTRLERSFQEARRMVSALDDLSLSEKRKITIPLIRGLLEQEGEK